MRVMRQCQQHTTTVRHSEAQDLCCIDGQTFLHVPACQQRRGRGTRSREDAMLLLREERGARCHAAALCAAHILNVQI